MAEKVQVEGLEKQSKAVAEVLDRYGVLGDFYEDEEKAEFIGIVSRSAREAVGSWESVEISYRLRGVRVVVGTETSADDVASIREVRVSAHPFENTEIDYSALQQEISEAISK